MKVIAGKGLRCPMEGNPKAYITDTDTGPVDVPETGYYISLLRDGSLERYQEGPAPAPKGGK